MQERRIRSFNGPSTFTRRSRNSSLQCPASPAAFRRSRRSAVAHSVHLARYLLGKVVVHDIDDGRLSGRTVETEAYPVGDSTGHAFLGETNASSFLRLN